MRHAIICLGMLVLSCSLQVKANEYSEPSEYTIKQSRPSLGSNFRKNILMAGYVPINKRYTEFSDEELDVLKSDYKHMRSADEPPFPVDGLQSVVKPLADLHEQLSLQYKGVVTIHVKVDSEGKPESAAIIESPSDEITKMAAYTLLLVKYKPAVCDGAPCSSVYIFHAELVGPTERRMEHFGPAEVQIKGNTYR